MDSIIPLIQTLFYPLGYFLILGFVYAVSRFVTLFLIGGGRMKAYHTVENYWIYLFVTLLCAIVGIFAGFGHWIVFCRWFLCSLFAGLLGVHFGYDKGLALSEEELKELEDEVDDEIRRIDNEN